MGQFFVYGIFLFFAVAVLITMWNDRQIEKRRRAEAEQMLALAKQQGSANVAVAGDNKATRDLFLDTLTKIGCQYKLGEGDDTRIFFSYQGENMFADATNERPFVFVWDTYWEHVELYDIDEVSRMRKAINNANLNSSVTTVFTIDNEGSNMDVHSKTVFAFLPQIPAIEDYLKAELNAFFYAHQCVGNEMMKLRTEEQKV